jgi:hypothetical protein
MHTTAKKRRAYAIQVTFQSGDVAYLRHGSRIGAGPVVRFRDRLTADVNREFVQQGLNDGDQASVIDWEHAR